MLLNFTKLFCYVDLNPDAVDSIFSQANFDKLRFINCIHLSALDMEKYSKKFDSSAKIASNSM